MEKNLDFQSLPSEYEFEEELAGLTPPLQVELIQGERYELIDFDTVSSVYDFLFDIQNGIDPQKPFGLSIADATYDHEDTWAGHPSLTPEQRNRL